jgi:uncharacterized DUF497 family protein
MYEMPGDGIPPGFEWDPAKAERNSARHGVTFPEAATVFDDPVAFAREDDEHSQTEDRFHVIGRSVVGRLLTVCYTMRGDITRIISAWSASVEDRREYHEQYGDNTAPGSR